MAIHTQTTYRLEDEEFPPADVYADKSEAGEFLVIRQENDHVILTHSAMLKLAAYITERYGDK